MLPNGFANEAALSSCAALWSLSAVVGQERFMPVMTAQRRGMSSSSSLAALALVTAALVTAALAATLAAASTLVAVSVLNGKAARAARTADIIVLRNTFLKNLKLKTQRILSHCSFKRYAKKLLCLDGKLHRQLVEHLLGIAVHDEAHGLLCGYATLVTVEELVFADL